MLQVFFGHDDRVEAGTTAFIRSAIFHARRPIALTPISRKMGAMKEGSNAFTFRRFLVPWVMHYSGWAIFVDGSDMLCRADLNELGDLFDPTMAVQVVKHRYKTIHPRKFLGSSMEADNQDYERKNWCAVMIINAAHYEWRKVTPEFIESHRKLDILQLSFIDDRFIGELPDEWNCLVDEHGENPNAKLIHFTAGVPGFEHYKNAPMADEWHAAMAAANTVTG